MVAWPAGGEAGLSDQRLRALGAALAVVAALVHLALGAVDLIPGEPTRGPLFALMGIGYVACAVGILRARPRGVDLLVLIYSVALVLAYVTSRSALPVEPIGIVTKVAESGVAAITFVLARRGGWVVPGT